MLRAGSTDEEPDNGGEMCDLSSPPNALGSG